MQVALVLHQQADLLAGQRAAQVRHRPARVHQNRRFRLVNIVQDKLARAEITDQAVDGRHIQRRGSIAGAVQPFEDALFVVLGLHLADKPRPGVGQTLIVDILRVLCGDHHPQPKGARLL